MDEYVISLDNLAATGADRVGPKAANLAVLAQAGLPTSSLCLTADAYRRQIAQLGLSAMLHDSRSASTAQFLVWKLRFLRSRVSTLTYAAASTIVCGRSRLAAGNWSIR